MSAETPETGESSRHVKKKFNNCRRSFQHIRALMVAVEFAAVHDAEFVVSDALAAILILIEQTLDTLDKLEAAL